MRDKKKVESKMEAMEICKNIDSPRVRQRAVVPKDVLKFLLRKPQILCISIFMTL